MEKNIHLIISSIIVFSAAIIYGFYPSLFFNTTINSADESSILKAIMGLYFCFALLWVLAIIKPAFWQVATISNGVFMFGIGIGRLLSLFIDGKPSTVFVIGLFGEFILAWFAIYQLRKFKTS